ncbi:MAG: histidine phosphatase family protein [Clostridia bacterium]|nr:histidine phosphatase family protein [Clostridia bacterium]
MTRIYLIRHAEASGNTSMRYHGHYDSEITKKGRIQLERLGERFKDIVIDAVYSSDLKRAYETARAVVGDRDIQIIRDAQLRELNGGEWENLEWKEIMEDRKEEFKRFNDAPDIISTPGGESASDLQIRIANKIFEIVKNNPEASVCIVSHAIAIKTFLCYARAIPVKYMGFHVWCKNTSVTTMDIAEDGRIRILAENDASHLIGLE